MEELTEKKFSWEDHSGLVKGFHEDIIISNVHLEHMSPEAHLQLLRRSKEHGVPAYMRSLQEAYEAGEDGMFIWEVDNKVIGWSWLKVYENEFFKEGVYGAINEIYVVPEWRGKGIGKAIMIHAHNWFRKTGIRVIRVEALASNRTAVEFYRNFGYEPNYITFQKILRE